MVIDARNAVVPERVRQAIVQHGEDLAELAESVAGFAVDMIGGENPSSHAKLLERDTTR